MSERKQMPVTMAQGERGVARVVTLPPPSPGFIGEGHTVVPVIDSGDFERTDPFILLMDDRVDLPPGRHAGGAHPHAGFEIATFVVDGALRDRDEGVLSAGDVAWMTAGSGVVHNEDMKALGKVRILQLWVTLPSAFRWAVPRFKRQAFEEVPVHREPGAEAHVYSGSSGSVKAGAHTYLPLTMVDIKLKPHAVFDQELPASYNGFVYVLQGDVAAGRDASRVQEGQVGWLDGAEPTAATNLRLTAGTDGARVVLYAGERQGVPIVTHGPFVGETRADLVRQSTAYTQGRMPRVSELRSQ